MFSRFWKNGLAPVLLISLVFIGNGQTAMAKPLIVVTFSIPGEWVQRVAGELAEVRVLVGPDGDAHTYEPVPRDSVALQHAMLVVENGMGFDAWIAPLRQAARSRARSLVLTGQLEWEAAGGKPALPDPHVWQSVPLAIQMVAEIRDQLMTADPAHAESYRKNAAAYSDELAELDQWIRRQVAVLPVHRRILVTSHDTLGYFARTYGFEVLGTALGVSTEAADPSAEQLAHLMKIIRQAKVPALFAENTHNSRVMATLAREGKIKVVTTLYSDALGLPGTAGASYVKMMRFNVSQIIEALK